MFLAQPNKVRGHKHQKFIVLQFRRLELQNQDISAVGWFLPRSVEGRHGSRPHSLAHGWTSSTSVSSHCLLSMHVLLPTFLFVGEHWSCWRRAHANDLILTCLSLQRPCFQARSHSEVWGIRYKHRKGVGRGGCLIQPLPSARCNGAGV